MKLLLTSAPAEGGDDAPALAPEPAAPPAALKVKESDVRESDAAELVELRRKVAETESRAKKAETDAAYLQDENRKLKEPAAPKRKRETPWTYFDERAEGAD